MFILASKSPRREELLSRLGLCFDIITADIDETMDETLPLSEAVLQVCRKKAAAVGEKHPGRLILAADTVVVVDDTVLGKPHTEQEAGEMLRLLSGREHHVITGCCLWRDGTLETFHETTSIRFKPLSDAEIDAYIATGEPLQVAGSFTIDSLGGAFIERVDGDPHAVVGLSVSTLRELLASSGVRIIDLWK